MVFETLKLFTIAVILFGCVFSVVLGDEYIDESKGYCDTKKDLLSCGKYRLLKYITNYTDNSIVVNNMGPLRLMRFDNAEDEESLFNESPRYFPGDGEFSKFLKFVQRQINHFLNHQGIVISLPQGARVIEYDAEYKDVTVGEKRGKKKKVDMLLQMITIFKLFKVKVLVALTLVAVMVIKKILLAGAFILPSIIHNLKMNCRAAAMNSYHHFEEHHDDHHAGVSGFGGVGGYGHSAYGGNYVDKSYQRRH